MITRRGFLGRLGAAAGGVIVAPTLVETLAIGTKKYFFLGGREDYTGVVAMQFEHIQATLPELYGLPYESPCGNNFRFGGLSRDSWPRIRARDVAERGK